MEKSIRRRSDPLMCQYLWDAITTIRNHKQLPSFDRIRRYMNRTHSMEADKVEKHLDECTLDNLIIVSRKVGQKGSKVGVEQEGFRLPSPPDDPDTHDWYCFECHQSGEVACCSKCYRVFHPTCLDSQDFPFHPNLFVCPICKKRLYQRSSGRSRIAREELNGLLGFIIPRLKERLPVNILERVVTTTTQKSNVFVNDRGAGHSQGKAEPNGGINLSEPWRAQLLLHHQMDLRTMEQKAQDGRYKSLFDFEIDALTIVHNVIIFHGAEAVPSVHSTISDMARQMLRDCQHDLQELDQCKDCFQYSRERNERFWFCKPCSPPHELVYAKEKGFPYWPAKVLRVENDVYHVRFFGNQHQIADVDKSCIKPITTNLNSIQVKRTSAWLKAYEELKKHQEFLVNGYHEQPQPPLPPPPPPPPPHSSAFQQHAFQPPPPPFQQPYHPFHAHQQYHPQYPQPHHLIHPHQQQPHWDAVQSSDQHQRVVQSGMASHPHLPFVSPVKKECEAENTLANTTKDNTPSPMGVVCSDKRDKEDKKESEVVASRSDETTEREDSKTTAYTPNEDQASSISSSSKAKYPKKEPPVPEDVVSSSSQEHRTHSQGVQTSPRLIKMLVEEMGEHGGKKNKNNKDSGMKELADKLRKEHEHDKQRAIQLAIKQKEKELEKSRDDLESKYKQKISDTKRKQWCWTCEAEAIYHCCWNTAYCSIECQQQHWHKEHKKNCRRKHK